jgi:Zn-dependent protease with chaperone function
MSSLTEEDSNQQARAFLNNINVAEAFRTTIDVAVAITAKTIDKTLGNLIFPVFFSSSQKASDETIQLIKSLAQEIGIENSQSIMVRNSNSLNIFLYGYENAFVHQSLKGKYIFINEAWLSELSLDEKRFLIGCELMRLKKGHLTINTTINILSDMIFPLRDALIKHDNMQKKERVAFYIILLSLNTLMRIYERNQIKEADMESAKQFKTAAAGIKLLQKKKIHEYNGSFSRKINAVLDKIYDSIKFLPVIKYFQNTPSWDNRIRYLQPIALEQEQSTSNPEEIQ